MVRSEVKRDSVRTSTAMNPTQPKGSVTASELTMRDQFLIVTSPREAGMVNHPGGTETAAALVMK